MNHRYCLVPLNPLPFSIFAALAFLVLTGTAVSTASAQRGGSIPADLKAAVDARPRADVVKDFIKTQVAALQNEKDPVAQQKARDALVRESSSVGATASPSYLEVYAASLNEQLSPLAGSANARTRLLAAIALQRVARNTSNGKLADAAAKFARDPIAGVALWAVKASQSIVPPLAAAGTPHKLTGEVASAVQTHSTSGDVAEEAYKGLTLDLKTALVTDKSIPVVANDVLKLVESRIGLYSEVSPPRPELEIRGINFLTLGRLWDTKDGTKMRPAIMQQISNLIGVSSQHAVVRESADRKEFVDQLQKVGDALVAIGGRADIKDENLQKAGKGLKELQATMPEVEFTDRATAAYDAIKARFAETKPAPTINPTASQELSPDEIPETADKGTDAATTVPAAPAPTSAPAPGKVQPRTSAPAPTPATRPRPATPAPATSPRPAAPAPAE